MNGPEKDYTVFGQDQTKQETYKVSCAGLAASIYAIENDLDVTDTMTVTDKMGEIQHFMVVKSDFDEGCHRLAVECLNPPSIH